MSTRGACNEVWWSPYPTNLQPPVQPLVGLEVQLLLVLMPTLAVVGCAVVGVGQLASRLGVLVLAGCTGSVEVIDLDVQSAQ